MGKGRRDPELELAKDELLVLRRDDERLTSLLGGIDDGGVVSRNMDVVEPVGEKANEPFDCATAPEPGRETGVLLESRDEEMEVDRRRSQRCGWALGVLARDLSLPSARTAMSPLVLTLDRGSKLLLTSDFASSEWDRPNRGAGRVRRLSGVEKEKA